jgi:hypothetical protein
MNMIPACSLSHRPRSAAVAPGLLRLPVCLLELRIAHGPVFLLSLGLGNAALVRRPLLPCITRCPARSERLSASARALLGLVVLSAPSELRALRSSAGAFPDGLIRPWVLHSVPCARLGFALRPVAHPFSRARSATSLDLEPIIAARPQIMEFWVVRVFWYMYMYMCVCAV